MNAVAEMPAPLIFTDSAANKVKELIDEEGNTALKLRVFVTGGGCSGFQYGFTFDEEVGEDDTTMEKNGVTLLIDAMSYQYLLGAEIDYQESVEGALRYAEWVGPREGKRTIELDGRAEQGLPRTALYRDWPAFRSLKLTLEQVHETDGFPADIWAIGR